MSDVMVLCGAEPRKILQSVIEKRIPAIMSYLSRGKWHVAKVLLANLGANRFDIEVAMPGCEGRQGDRAVSPRKKPRPVNIQVDQPVGISLKHGYGKFIFETKVVALEPSKNSEGSGIISLEVPDRIEMVQRRSYFRVDVPKTLKVNVMLWHRDCKGGNQQVPPSNYWQGKLVDISAGGAQIVVDAAQDPDFRKGQFVGLRFTPMPYETPLMFNAQIRNILPTAEDNNICIGLQMVGLEASVEGRQILQRLCNVVEQYYQINQSGAKQQDMQLTGK